MADEYMKVTHHLGNGNKRNINIIPHRIFGDLKSKIASYFFENNDKSKDFRIYWIDEDSDEIDIYDQNHLDIYIKRNNKRRHLHIVSLIDGKDESKKESNTSNPQLDKFFPTTAVHPFVECDNCNMKPIIGFRYKCVECNNFDICQRCEALHCHPEHMMVRLPHNDCPTVIESLVTSRTKRSHKRANRKQCPFMSSTANEMPGSAPGGGDTERPHHSRRSHKHRDLNSGIFGNLYTMMHDLAEGDVDTQCAEKVAEASAASAAAVAAAAAAAATTTAAAVASNAAKSVSEAFQAAESQTENGTSKPKEQENQPRTPPTTPNDAGVNGDIPTPLRKQSSVENFTQLLDPQFVSSGIRILNNFSEMFAKMLEPNDGVGMDFSLGGAAKNSGSKNSSTSTTSTSNTESNSIPVNIEKSASVPKKADEEAKKSESEAPSSTMSTTPNSIRNAGKNSQTPEDQSRRSASIEDNDWQLIGNPTNVINNEPESVTSSTPKSVAQSVDFAQLSKDLQAHIENEQKRKKLEKGIQTPQNISSINPNAMDTSEISETSETSETSIISESTQTPVPQPRTGSSDEKRAVIVYHHDSRINSAVHAMMSMGFSNEGNYLTQLLETVDGNITQALDIMESAQRNN